VAHPAAAAEADQEQQQQALAQLLTQYDDESQQGSQEQALGQPGVKQEADAGLVKAEVKVEVKQEQEEEGPVSPGVGPGVRVKEEPGVEAGSSAAPVPQLAAPTGTTHPPPAAVPLRPPGPGSGQEQAQQGAGQPACSSGGQDDMQAIKAVMDKLVSAL
jgi:hypothetical protein